MLFDYDSNESSTAVPLIHGCPRYALTFFVLTGASAQNANNPALFPLYCIKIRLKIKKKRCKFCYQRRINRTQIYVAHSIVQR